MAGLESVRVAKGRSRAYDHLRILWETFRPPPADVGRRFGRWVADPLAEHLGVTPHVVRNTWREYGLHPTGRTSYPAPDAGGRLSPRFDCWRTMVLAWFAIGERRRPRHGRIDVARRFADGMRMAVLGWRSATVSYTWIRAVDGPPEP